jgi:hypothetical protein
VAETNDSVYLPGLGVFYSNRGQAIKDELEAWRSGDSSTLKEFLKYPDFANWLAGYFYDSETQESPIDRQLIAARAGRYGVPASALNALFGGGGGGSGINRADELRSISTTLLNRSVSFGMSLTPEEIDYLARVAQQQSFSSEQLDTMLVDIANWDKLESGTLTASRDQIKALSSSYLVGMSEQTIQDWSEKIAKGQATAASIESYLRNQAKVMNPWMAQYIDQGLSPAELLQTSRDLIAENLELDANTVDFSQDRYMSLATVTDDKGNTRLASQQELLKNIRKDAAWSQTAQAKNVVSGTAQLIASIFGRSAF